MMSMDFTSTRASCGAASGISQARKPGHRPASGRIAAEADRLLTHGEHTAMRLRPLFVFALVTAVLVGQRARADEAEGHYRMGLDYERKGDYANAAREVKEAVHLRPGHAAAWLSLGAIERKQGHLDASLQAFDQVIKL